MSFVFLPFLDIPLVQSVFFSVSSQAVYSFTGYNYIYGARHLVEYSSPDLCIANLIRNNIRYSYGVNSPCEGFISYIYVLLTFFFYIFCAVLLPVYICINNNNNIHSRIRYFWFNKNMDEEGISRLSFL